MKNGSYYYDQAGHEYKTTRTTRRLIDLYSQIRASPNGCMIDGNKLRVIDNREFKPWSIGLIGRRYYKAGDLVKEEKFKVGV